MKTLKRLPIGEVIRAIRHEQGLTQTELAEAAEMSQQRISAIETADSTNLATLERLAAALGMDASGILRRAEEEAE